jgi:CheY-like chemotaxis protein
MLTDQTPRPARILLCDDSPVERLALAHFLRGSGYLVDEAGDGDAAILHMKHREMDLVLLDLHMPEVDGFGVLTYLQEHRRGLPVILLSGMPLHKIQHRMHELPTPELPPLLIKPIDPDQLLGMIELQLSGQMPEFDSADDAGVESPAEDPNSDSASGMKYR